MPVIEVAVVVKLSDGSITNPIQLDEVLTATKRFVMTLRLATKAPVHHRIELEVQLDVVKNDTGTRSPVAKPEAVDFFGETDPTEEKVVFREWLDYDDYPVEDDRLGHYTAKGREPKEQELPPIEQELNVACWLS